MDLFKISDGKYKFKDQKINGGAFSKIYDVDNKINKKNNYVIKLHKYKYRKEAINEIDMLLKLKKNTKKFKENLKNIINDKSLYSFKDDKCIKSKLIKIKDFYITNDYIITVFKKYHSTLDEFNIQYNKKYHETLPVSLIKKIFNSMFIGLYELHFSKLIHCDIKPNNILIDLFKYKSIDQIFKDIDNKKLKKEDIHKYIDIKIIDFNKTQSIKSIFKSVNVQTLYYTPPEIILGNRNFNYSIDVWAMMNIIYELVTSTFLFDVFNENDANGLNYMNYHNSKDSDNSGNSEDSEEYEGSDSNSYSGYSYNDESMSNLALLYIYKYKLGDNNFVEGNYVDKYYSYGKLIGLTNIEYKNIDIIHPDIEFTNILLSLCNKIYIYDFKNRITSEEIIMKYLF